MTVPTSASPSKPTSMLVDLNKPATIQISEFQGTTYASVRYMYEMDNGKLGFSKNGVNVPIEWTKTVIEDLLVVYNNATGSTLALTGENMIPDPIFDADGDELNFSNRREY